MWYARVEDIKWKKVKRRQQKKFAVMSFSFMNFISLNSHWNYGNWTWKREEERLVIFLPLNETTLKCIQFSYFSSLHKMCTEKSQPFHSSIFQFSLCTSIEICRDFGCCYGLKENHYSWILLVVTNVCLDVNKYPIFFLKREHLL